MKVKQPKIIYPCGFETININKQEEQEKSIDEVVAQGYMPVFIFNDDPSNTENFIPTSFKEHIENHPAYFEWIDMLMRCYDSSHPKYKEEGAKNIKVYEPWISSFSQFCKDMKFSSEMI
jgi:hypothetical protein